MFWPSLLFFEILLLSENQEYDFTKVAIYCDQLNFKG